MDNERLWLNFLENIKSEISSTSFDVWFSDDETQLYSLENNVLTISVKEEVSKKHLENHYLPQMKEIFDNLTNSNINIIIELKSILDEKNKINNQNNKLKEFNLDNISENTNALNANLSPEYTFDTFLVGDSNKFAYKVSRVIAEEPGTYNPLFLYGESGVGKTHLMHAIGNYLVDNTNKKVLYVPSGKFVDEYTKIFRYSEKNSFEKIDSFKEKYSNVDVLIIDDIQFLANAPKGREEFFHIFEELHNSGKQIIIASDRSVDDLNSFENRLLTRFNWGLTANISTPDYELRVNIIKNKLAFNSAAEDLPDEVIEYIANNFDTDIRNLGMAVTRVLAYSSMFNKGRITLDSAVDALKDLLKDRSFYKNDVQRIQRVVCDYYKISIDDMKSKKKNNDINFPRQIAIYLCRELTTESFPKIGSYFGGRNHSTMISADQKIRKMLEDNEKLKDIINELKNELT